MNRIITSKSTTLSPLLTLKQRIYVTLTQLNVSNCISNPCPLAYTRTHTHTHTRARAHTHIHTYTHTYTHSLTHALYSTRMSTRACWKSRVSVGRHCVIILDHWPHTSRHALWSPSQVASCFHMLWHHAWAYSSWRNADGLFSLLDWCLFDVYVHLTG